MRSKNTRFSKQKYNIKNEPPNKPPPFGHGPKRNNPLREVLDGFPAPSFARFGLGKNSEPFLRTSLDRLGAPPFALWTCTNFEQSRGSTLPPFGVEIGFKKRTGLLCDLLDAPGQPPCAERDVYSLWKHPHVRFVGQDSRTLLRTSHPFVYLVS